MIKNMDSNVPEIVFIPFDYRLEITGHTELDGQNICIAFSLNDDGELDMHFNNESSFEILRRSDGFTIRNSQIRFTGQFEEVKDDGVLLKITFT